MRDLARRYEGLGLGLPLAVALVRLHGGRLAVTSTVGKGTIVTIALPADRVLMDDSPDAVNAPPAPPRGLTAFPGRAKSA